MLIWILVMSLAVFCIHSIERKAKTVSYNLVFDSSIQNCENFNNKAMDPTGMELITNASKSWLEGSIQIKEEIVPGTIIKTTVHRKDEFTGQYILYYTVEGDVCEHITDKEVPWAVLFQAMRINSCPIEAKTYEDVTINLNVDYAAKELLSHEACGLYKCDIEMLVPGSGGQMAVGDDRISCHSVYTELVQIMQEA